MKVAPLLLAVKRDVRRVEVEYELRWRLIEALDEHRRKGFLKRAKVAPDFRMPARRIGVCDRPFQSAKGACAGSRNALVLRSRTLLTQRVRFSNERREQRVP